MQNYSFIYFREETGRQNTLILNSVVTNIPDFFSLSLLGSTDQLRPWPPPKNPAEFLGGFSIFFFTG
jgi:hypothetical protein